MGKKKDADGKVSKAKSSKAKSKIKIPKQIAGVTIPKTLRDSGKAAIKLAQNPAARELLSAGLVAAAAAVAANSRARKAAVDGGREAADAMGEATAKASDSAAKFSAALAGAAGIAAQRFFGLGDDGTAKPVPTDAASAKSSEPDVPETDMAEPSRAEPDEPVDAPVAKTSQRRRTSAAEPAPTSEPESSPDDEA